MNNKNSVFIATSIDGYISDKNGRIEWLNSVPNPNQEDMGYTSFMKNIDALVMGRTTFETVCGFDLDWPYDKPVYVLSNTLNDIPESHQGKAFLLKGPLAQVLKQIHTKGHKRLYVDGGATIQGFLQEDLIDELIITVIPIVLGGGSPLFSALPKEMEFDLVKSETFLSMLTQTHYKRKR